LVQRLGHEGLAMPALLTSPAGAGENPAGVAPAGVTLAPGHPLPAAVVADLRTDHAGETGAVCIYQGVLRFARDPALRAFAERHLATEQAHLQAVEPWLAPADHSRLLPLWRLAGWLTGALPALLGPRAVYATIEAVERFVDHHYAEQIQRFAAQPALSSLRQTLVDCQADEVAHREEASRALGAADPGAVVRAWGWMVGAGSRGAVAVCRRL
jgi:ubiquinone biosynthesis monooxygenase Coq7